MKRTDPLVGVISLVLRSDASQYTTASPNEAMLRNIDRVAIDTSVGSVVPGLGGSSVRGERQLILIIVTVHHML